ncbi:MAG: SurA N-terminal domain-containing protein [Aaplasma endosymbiont of Hyalomma asiaticum]
MSRWFLWLCALCFVVPSVHACASVKIEAVVDDRVLTSLDVERRVEANGFFYKTSHAWGNKDEVLQSLVDEMLLELEAKELGMSIEANEVSQEVERLFSVLGVCREQSVEECASSNNLDSATVRAHVRSRVIWGKMLAQRIMPFLGVSEDEVMRRAEEAVSSGLETVLDLEQVFVPFKSGSVLDSVHSEFLKGVELNKIAERYREHGVYVDKTVGAAVSGFVPDVKARLLRSDVGSIIGPVKIDRGYLLLKLLGKVRVSRGFMNSTVSLKQLSVPVESVDAVYNDLKDKSSDCGTFVEAMRGAGFQPADLVVKVKDLSSKLQYMLENAILGEVLRSDDVGKVDFVVLCGITKESEPAQDDMMRIRHAVYTDKLIFASNRLMEEIRKRHFIKRL